MPKLKSEGGKKLRYGKYVKTNKKCFSTPFSSLLDLEQGAHEEVLGKYTSFQRVDVKKVNVMMVLFGNSSIHGWLSL